MIKCSKCRKTKEETEFYRRSDRDSVQSWCKKCIAKKKHNHYQRTKNEPHFRWQFAKSQANHREIDFNLSEEDHAKIIIQPCYYCSKSIADEVGCGLDRLNNDEGYSLQNVVACCGTCNSSRGDRYTPEEWKVMAEALVKFRNEREVG